MWVTLQVLTGVQLVSGDGRSLELVSGVNRGVGHFAGVKKWGFVSCGGRLGASGGAKGWVSGGRGGAGKGRKEQEFGRQMTVRRLV